MSICTELAIFKVPKENLARVIELSIMIFAEINVAEQLLLSHQIFQKTDNENEICWQLVWVDQAAVDLSTEKWPSYPSTKELESLVADKIYYGHFNNIG